MDRSEGVNVAVGAVLVGFGAVILGLIAPEAAYVASALCLAGGGYLVVGVYRGWPLPTTAAERAFRPKLSVPLAEITRTGRDFAIFQIAVVNDGRDDVKNAMVNVVVPDFVSEMSRCTPDGETGLEQHKGAFWRENEKFWNGNVSFDGRMAQYMFFRVTLPALQPLHIRLKIVSPALNTPLEQRIQLTMPESGAPSEAPETGEQAS